MKGWVFALCFFAIAMLHLAQTSWLGQLYIDFSLIVIMLIIRSSSSTRTVLMTFIMSLGLDLIFQSNQIKGIHTMVQMLLGFAGCQIKHFVIPSFSDLILFVFFVVFYLMNYYMYGLLSELFGMPFEPISFMRVLYQDLWHTLVFGGTLYLILRYGKPSS
ncbi:MAG: hypothetical protein KDC71_08270 [Acidobacteria bacterium]|nr:hypothetical protein [Acidobacteriota bacterium]